MKAFGPVTVTAHACACSLVVVSSAAVASSLCGFESPAPLSREGLAALAKPETLGALAYAAGLSTVLGYSLRAWASARLDASTLVLYNAAQPPMTAAIAALCAGAPRAHYGTKELASTALVICAVAVAATERRAAERPKQAEPHTTPQAALS